LVSAITVVTYPLLPTSFSENAFVVLRLLLFGFDKSSPDEVIFARVCQKACSVAYVQDVEELTALAQAEGEVALGKTVTVIEHVAVLPELSVTVQMTVVVPTGYVPLALFVPLKLLLVDATLQLSAVVGDATVTAAVHAPAPAVTETFAGHVIVGAIKSVTVTV
jgi:hypothetical protein